jgi:RNA polymerase sigma factor (sigma-70 family)
MDFESIRSLSKRKSEQELSFNEEMLVVAAKAGQDWAFVELCSRSSKRILFALYRITQNAQDAEDALQESILKAFVHFRDFKQTSSFSTWFTRISINSALMLLRRRRSHPEASTDGMLDENMQPIRWDVADRHPSPEDNYILSESHKHLQAAILRLPKNYRRAFEVCHQVEGSAKKAAEEAGISIAAAKSRLLRARKALRDSLNKGEGRIRPRHRSLV